MLALTVWSESRSDVIINLGCRMGTRFSVAFRNDDFTPFIVFWSKSRLDNGVSGKETREVKLRRDLLGEVFESFGSRIWMQRWGTIFWYHLMKQYLYPSARIDG